MNTLGAPPSFTPFAEKVGETYPEVTAVIPLNEYDFAAYTPTQVMIGCFMSVGFLGFFIEISETHPLNQ